METITTIANAANKAIWGTNEANQEPVSGVKGNTNQGEPYDAGNIEDPLIKEKKANIADANNASGTTGPAVTSEPSATTGVTTTSTPNTSTASTEPTGTSTTDDSSTHKSNPPTENTLPDRSRATEVITPNKSSTTGDSSKHQDIGKPELSKTSPSEVPPADSASGKTDTREPADPATDPAPKGQDVSNKSSGPIAGGDKLDGPGPKPLEIVAKERGGDAGNAKDSAKGGLVKGDSTSGIEDKNENDPREPSHGEGTGEKYVKSSGLAVDGGDFDATKPGAGREADRKCLLDEKDPAHAAAKADGKSSSDKTSDKTSEVRTHSPKSGTETEKESLKDKIKAKLHRH
ncbi:uncharacterized protein GLRG_08417 [Colletotrichum graminicola M1.001]|uniref:Glycine-rich cell wall structural protein 1 n=1 Tax=Colletotrichum graminicola (strain M1.001 / M2 / FGSC 10212) TaxID=645133 RepID=E3QQY5_COLGM|nr:uncharacterized protein GLRG_08417 [Colletotrichum graminicola M1.001]EFQ33273.1 hypothetical protein GLRG_08417 [Colletotrichum graminicola M1.001]